MTRNLRPPDRTPLRTWDAYAFAVIMVVALALLSPTPEVRAAATVVLVLGTWIAGFAPRAVYGAVPIALCLILNGWLTPNLFPDESRLVGVNVGNIAAGVGFVAYFFRARPRIRWPWTSITIFCSVLVTLDILVMLRGIVLTEEMSGYGTGLLRMWCLWLWVRRASTELSRADILRLGTVIAAGPILVAVSTLVAVLTLGPTTYTELMNARIKGLYDPNYATLGAVMVAPWAIMSALRAGASTFQRSVSGLLVIAVLIALPFSGSRTGMAAAVGAIMIALILKRRAGAAVLIVVLGAVFYLAWEQLPAVLAQRFESIQGFEDARSVVYGNAIREFLLNPLFGTGRFTYFKGPEASIRQSGHNTLLVGLAEGGMTYVFVWIGLMWAIARVGWQDWRRTHDWVPLAFVVSWVAFIVGSNGIGISLIDYLSSILAASCALMCGAQMEPRPRWSYKAWSYKAVMPPDLSRRLNWVSGGPSLVQLPRLDRISRASSLPPRRLNPALISGAELPES